MASHLGVRPSDHVVLEWVRTNEPTGAWQRILPDATAQFPFEIPKGRYLIITDLDWRFQSADQLTPQCVTFRLYLAPLNQSSNPLQVHESTTQLDFLGCGGSSEAMTTGFVVDENAKVIWDSWPINRFVTHILLRGYLIDRS